MTLIFQSTPYLFLCIQSVFFAARHSSFSICDLLFLQHASMQMCVFKLKLTEKYRQMRDYEEGKTCQGGWVKFQGINSAFFIFAHFLIGYS